MVNKGDDLEQSLYNKVRNAEYARQQQEQSVRRTQQALAETKRLNNLKLTQEIAERHRQEKELEQSLLKEKAELDKVSQVLALFTCIWLQICIIQIYSKILIKY